MARIEAPSPPYLGPPAHFSGGNNKPINRVVIHATVSPCERGGARNIAAYFRSKSAGGSAQYVADPGEVVQAAYDSVICWAAPPNPHSLHVELCDPMRGPGKRWKDRDHQAMLKNAAALVAQLCLAYDVPVRRIDVADLKAGRKGICGHDDVSDAFHQSSHWDPGPAFPWAQFMELVRREAKRLTRGQVVVPVPEPDKEAAQPSLVLRARRLLARATRGTDNVHRRSRINAALKRLPKA